MTIQLTDAQRAELAAKMANNPEVRVTMAFTPEQQAAYREAAAAEDARQEERQEYYRQLRAAAREPGLCGDLRRAIFAIRVPQSEIAERIGVTSQALEEFCLGRTSLSSDTLDRLTNVLGLHLVQKIPDLLPN